jgi:hypothetical protein
MIKESSDFRIQFLFEDKKAVAIDGLIENGTLTKYSIDEN